MTGVVAVVTAAVASVLLAVVASNAFAVVAVVDVAEVADGCRAFVTTLTAATDVVGDDGAVAVLAVAAGFELDSGSA
jgi:hypothetical protein